MAGFCLAELFYEASAEVCQNVLFNHECMKKIMSVIIGIIIGILCLNPGI